MATKSNITPLKTPESEGGEFELVPAGVYLARCYKMVDVGTHETTYQGKPAGKRRQIYLWWELLKDQEGTDVFMDDGERIFSIMQNYTWSMNPKANLRQIIDNWRGKPLTEEQAKDFEITQLLDKYCLLQVVHRTSANKRTYANVATIMPAKQHDIGVNEDSSFSIEAPDLKMFEEFPDWLKDKIRAADEWSVDTKDGSINAEGEIVIENIADDTPGVTKEELDALPFS